MAYLARGIFTFAIQIDIGLWRDQRPLTDEKHHFDRVPKARRRDGDRIG